jgi:hypothetical protein
LEIWLQSYHKITEGGPLAGCSFVLSHFGERNRSLTLSVLSPVPVSPPGIKPVDSMGRGIVTAYSVPVECGKVLVHPGDFVFGDRDGIVVVPREMVKQTLEMAANKVQRENHSRAELMNGDRRTPCPTPGTNPVVKFYVSANHKQECL